ANRRSPILRGVQLLTLAIYLIRLLSRLIRRLLLSQQRQQVTMITKAMFRTRTAQRQRQTTRPQASTLARSQRVRRRRFMLTVKKDHKSVVEGQIDSRTRRSA